MLPSAEEHERCLHCTGGAVGSSFVPSSLCPGKCALARWRRREVRCPCLCGEGYWRDLSGDGICELLLPRSDSQRAFGHSSATQAYGQLPPIASSLVGAHLKQWWRVTEQVPSGVLKVTISHCRKCDIGLQMLVGAMAGEQREKSLSGTAPRALADTDNSCTELQVLGDWHCQSLTGNTIYGPGSIWVQKWLQNNGPDSVERQEE